MRQEFLTLSLLFLFPITSTKAELIPPPSQILDSHSFGLDMIEGRELVICNILLSKSLCHTWQMAR